MKGDYQELLRLVEFQKRELMETRRALEEFKKENQLKDRECQDAWKSLQDLQNELMRKSMHVGSLGKEISLFSLVFSSGFFFKRKINDLFSFVYVCV